jgi:hypothetical protein
MWAPSAVLPCVLGNNLVWQKFHNLWLYGILFQDLSFVDLFSLDNSIALSANLFTCREKIMKNQWNIHHLNQARWIGLDHRVPSWMVKDIG